MEPNWLAAMRRALSDRLSRRSLVVSAGGLAVAGTLAPNDDADARKKGRRKKRRKNGKQKSAPKVRVDATCPGSEDTALQSSSGDDRMAQTFTATASGLLVKAQLSIGKDLFEESPGDFEVRLSPLDAVGTPTDEVLALSVVADDQVPDEGGFIDFPFSKPFSVVAGTGYALVLTRPGGGKFQWSFEGENPCGGEAFFAFGQIDPLTPNNDGFDHTFTTFVKS